MIKLISPILDGPLPPTEKLIMITLADFADERGRCWPSKEILARRSCVSKRTVDKYIKQLESDGWLTIQYNGGRKSNMYHLAIEKIIHGDEKTIHVDEVYPAGSAPLGCKPCTPDLQPMLHPTPATHVAPESPYKPKTITPAKVPPASRQEKKEPNPHRWFVAWWCFVYQQLEKQKYAMTKKDAGQVKQMLTLIGLGDLVVRSISYLATNPAKRFPRDGPATLGGLLCSINQLNEPDNTTIDKFTSAGLLPAEDIRLTSFEPWKESP